MNPQTPLTPYSPPPAPGASANAPSPAGISSQAKLQQTKRRLYIISGVAVVLLLACAFLSYRAFVNTGTLNTYYNNGVAAGKKAQAAADKATIADISQNPYRTYTAPRELGAFTVSYPRDWSVSLNEDTENPLMAYFNPNYVDVPTNNFALRVIVRNASFNQVKSDYETKVKLSKGKLTESAIKISDIDATRFSGPIDDKIPNGTVSILQVRDKVFLFQTDDNSKYLSYYNDIVNKVKINP